MQLTSTQVRALVWLALAALVWCLLWLLSPVLAPFVAAAAMAYVLQPLVGWLRARGVPPWLGAGLAVLLFSLVLTAVFLLVVPVVTRLLPLLREQLPPLLEQLNQWLTPWAARWGLDLQVDVSLVHDVLRRVVAGHEGDVAESLLSSLRIGGSALLALAGNLVLLPVAAYYLLLDWPRLIGLLRGLVPPRLRAKTYGFLDESDAVLGQYFRGQLLVMGLLAVFYTVGLALTGLQLAVPIGVFTGLAMFVPYLGFGLGIVLAMLAAVLQFQSAVGLLGVASVYAVGQVLESFVLTPRLVGERIGLHPVVVIFALLAFGHLLGFVGVLVALPASAVLLVAVRRMLSWYFQSKLFNDGSSGAAPVARQEESAR